MTIELIKRQSKPSTTLLKMKLAILATSLGAAAAFAPSSSGAQSSTAVRMSEPMTEEPVVAAVEEPVVPAVKPINGWVPDETKPLYGLPGAIAPLGFFDPLGFSNVKELTGAKRLREAEVMHGRVAMMATIGYIIGGKRCVLEPIIFY